VTRPPDPPPVYGPLFKVRAAAQYLGLTESRVRALIAAGELVALRNVRGRLDGVYQHHCDAWLKARLSVVTPPAPRRSGDERIAHLPGAEHFL